MMNKQVRFTTALTLGAAALSIPALAIAQLTFDIVDPASLVAKGAAAIVSAQITCDSVEPINALVFVNLNQSVSKSITNGSNQGNFSCSSTPQTVEIVMTASPAPFKSGPAFASGGLEVCADFCERVFASEEIRLRK